MNSKAVGVVWSEDEIPEGVWYQWIPEDLVISELLECGPWFYDQGRAALRDGARAVWVWSR